MKPFSQIMGGQSVLPIIQANSIDDGVKTAEIMQSTGLNVIEVVLRSPAALEMLTEIKRQLPSMIVSAGTVTNAQILGDAVNAGADYIITPTLSAALLDELQSCEVPVLPGVAVMSDILHAIEYGYSELKLFPAALAGGVPFLQAVNAVFPQVKFCPTGGISQDNKNDFLAQPNVFAVGGTWLAKQQWIQAQQWSAITVACTAAQHVAHD